MQRWSLQGIPQGGNGPGTWETTGSAASSLGVISSFGVISRPGKSGRETQFSTVEGKMPSSEERVSKLETHFEYIRRDLDDIRADIKAVSSALGQLPTRQELWQWRMQWVGVALVGVAMIVGGIIGGLDWIKPEVQPVIIQPQATAPAPAQN